MRKLLLSMLAVAVFLRAASLWAAEDARKPIVMASFSGYDKLMGNIGAIGRLGGDPNLGKTFEMVLQMMTQGKGLAGLDKARPWGAVLLTDGQQFTSYGFVPVTDLKQLVEVAKTNPRLADSITLNEGVYEIESSSQTVYAQQKGKWAVISNKSEDLAGAPADPLKLLGDLPQKYDLACRVSVKNIPSEFREMAVAYLQAGVAFGMAQMPEENEAGDNARAMAAKQMVQQVTTLLNEAEDLTLGWTVDRSTNTTYADFELRAQSGTKLAEQFAAMKPGKTNFAGFLMPDAAATANWAGTLSDADVARAKGNLTSLRKSLARELEKQGRSADELKQATHLADELFAVLEKNVEKKLSDGGFAVSLEPGAATVVAGVALADGARLEKALKELAAEVQKDNLVPADSIKLDAETYEGVRFHTLTVPTPKPELTPLVGDRLTVVVGTGDDRLFVAAGRDPAKLLKKVIGRSKAAAGKEVPPLRISLAVARIAKFIASVVEDEEAKARVQMAASLLEKAGAKDHVVITVKPVSLGVRMRLELEEGLLKVMGSMSPMGGPPPHGAAPRHGSPPKAD